MAFGGVGTVLLAHALGDQALLRTPAHRIAPQRMASAAPLMAISLPSFGGGSDAGSGPSEEALAYYRLLGLAEDAGYDEINSAHDSLASKYEGDVKMTIKLQVAKDKILDDKLRQRMSGSLKATSFAESPYDRKEAPKPLIKVPPFMADYVDLPSRAELQKNLLVFGAIGFLPMLSKSWAATSVGLGFATSLYTLYNRGVPASASEMGGEMRPPKVRGRPEHVALCTVVC